MGTYTHIYIDTDICACVCVYILTHTYAGPEGLDEAAGKTKKKVRAAKCVNPSIGLTRNSRPANRPSKMKRVLMACNYATNKA